MGIWLAVNEGLPFWNIGAILDFFYIFGQLPFDKILVNSKDKGYLRSYESFFNINSQGSY